MKNKILTIMTSLLVLTLVLTVATPVKAAAEPEKYGKLEIIGGSKGEVTADQTADVTVTVNETNLKWEKADTSVGRNVDGYWIGVKITAPTGIDVKKSTMTRSGVTKTFEAIKDGETYAGLWIRVDENKLAAATDELVLQEYEFSWVKTGGDETATKQKITVKVKVDKDKIKLDKEGTVSVKIGDKTFTLTEGNSLEDLTDKEKAVLAELKKAPKGKVYVSLVDKEGKEFKENTPITEDIELTVKFKNAPVAEEDEKDDTANTGVENVYAIAGLVAVIALAGAIILNKRK